MQIGILSEGKDDTTILKVLVRRILIDAFNIPHDRIVFLGALETHTSILEKMPVAIETFFDNGGSADVVIFGVDLDNQQDRRRKRVRKFIENELAKNLARSIIPLYADPHIEAHFITEGGNAIKAVLTGLNPTNALPHSTALPKSQIEKLIDEFAPASQLLTRTAIYAGISEALNLDLLARNNPDFRRFKEQLVASVATRGLV